MHLIEMFLNPFFQLMILVGFRRWKWDGIRFRWNWCSMRKSACRHFICVYCRMMAELEKSRSNISKSFKADCDRYKPDVLSATYTAFRVSFEQSLTCRNKIPFTCRRLFVMLCTQRVVGTRYSSGYPRSFWISGLLEQIWAPVSAKARIWCLWCVTIFVGIESNAV